MDHFIESINICLRNKNYYAALTLVLTIPDICSSIEHSESGGKKYADWFDVYVGAKYKTEYSEDLLRTVREHLSEDDYKSLSCGSSLLGSDCYALRCSLLHQGISEISHQRAREVLNKINFIEPNPAINIHKSIKNNVLNVHIDIFCEDIIEAYHNWKNDLIGEQLERFNNILLIENVFKSNMFRPIS